jgi:hypothetical protein
MADCQCSPCGRRFTSLSAFDQHHDTDYSRPTPIICLDPASVGLVVGPRGLWSVPLSEAGRARFATLNAERAEGRAA